ncbi:phage minor head protein [Sulfuriflexus mobilis]|uniref:phage head morphogenesis protein n=1 Tax=Sulfuriflexus mobilis TaxID=1811807 RepID=UPI000F81C200|nr:phage minor head protein [Sulfuriflexus mobilis]
MPDFTFPGPVPKDALDYFRDKELRVGFDYRDVWGEEHANAFTVAKAMQLDVLDDVRGALDEALADGTTFQQFKKELKPRLQKKGWWGQQEQVDPASGEKRLVQLGSPRRLKTIYRANLRSARAAGQWQRAQRTKKTHPYLIYELGPSEKHRAQHVAWAGIILPIDHPFWKTHYPPNGWGCKCRVRQVSRRERERLVATGNYLTEAPTIKTRKWLNKRTGESLDVPEGLDPAWMRNPGQDRTRVLRERLTQKVASVDQQYASAAVNSIIKTPVLDGWMKKPGGELPVGIISRDMQKALGSTSQMVRLSEATLDKQSRGHAELTAAHYRYLPDLIHRGVAIRQGKNKLVLFRREAGKWQKAVVKVTEDGKRVYLVSYHPADPREMRRMMKSGSVIRSVEK